MADGMADNGVFFDVQENSPLYIENKSKIFEINIDKPKNN
jgi:hypothetical protein